MIKNDKLPVVPDENGIVAVSLLKSKSLIDSGYDEPESDTISL